jgi:peroxiredoxin
MRPATRVAVLGLLAACGSAADRGTIPAPSATLIAPAVDGGTIDLRRYRGKRVELHFFTTWDAGSQHDVEALKTAAAQPDVVVIGVALDEDGRRLVAPWRRAMGVTYLVALGGAELKTNVAPARAVPATVVLDPRGQVRHRFDRPLQRGELARALAQAR